MYMYTVHMNLHHSRTQINLHYSETHLLGGNIDNYFGPENLSAPISGWVSDVKSILAVSKSAEWVCADLKILRSAKSGGDVRTLCT